MNFVVVGQGAIGLLWYHHLHHTPGINVSLACSKRIRTTPKHMQFTHLDGKVIQSTLKLATTNDLANADYLLLCLKAYDFESAFAQYLPQISQKTAIILCHNGMLDKTLLPQNHTILAMLTTHGSKKTASFSIEHTGKGFSDIGIVQDLLPNTNRRFLIEQLESALPDIHWQESIKEKQWQKLVINCVINPLTAIHDCNNGEITKESYHQDVHQIIHEILPLAVKSGVEFNPHELEQTVLNVAQNTAANTSSMRSDILAGRKTEIEHINGFIARLGASLDIETPKNSQLVAQVKALEAGSKA